MSTTAAAAFIIISTTIMMMMCSALSAAADWFVAFQVLICCGLAGLLISFLLISLYICVLGVSKNATIKALVAFCFITGNIMRSCSVVVQLT